MARTENGKDPVPSVGLNAILGAAARAVATTRGLINDPFAERLVRAIGVDFFIRVVGGEPHLAAVGPGAGFAPMVDVFAVRTRFFDNFFADAGRAGIRQAVILASGLDTRPYRLWWPPGATVYEIDEPDVIEFKNRTLRELGATPTTSRRAVGVDLRRDWPTALQRIGFDPARPSAWIAEGLLLGFWPPDAQDRLVDDITALTAAGSRFAADHIPAGSQSQAVRQGRALVDRWRKEGLDIGVGDVTYPGEYSDVAEYLAARGWETVVTSLPDLVATTGSPGLRLDNLAGPPASTRYITATRI